MTSSSLKVIAATVMLLLMIPLSNVVVSIEMIEFYPRERDALLQLRDSVASSLDLHARWVGPPCYYNQSRWVGVACLNSHVVGLVLEGVELTGSLPSSFLQNIEFLARLSFRNNTIFGHLPKLTNLQHLEYVFFSQNQFTGTIPLDYAELSRLRTLELQENYISGQIPPFDQPNLTSFNVSYNQLEGPIPQTDALKRFPRSSYEHNSDLCGNPLEKQCGVPPLPPSPVPPPPPPHKKKESLRVWHITFIVAAAVLVPVLVISFFLCYNRRMQAKETLEMEQTTGEGSSELVEKKRAASQSMEDPERRVELIIFNKNIPIFDLDDLLRASAEVLGKGKLGTTYKATLESGLAVAVKRVKNMNALTKKEFIQQMQLLGKLKHENLAQIISFYYSKEEKLVISEYIPNGNLFELLHGNRGVGRVPVNWATRLSIITDVAKGLAFLHQSLPSHKVPHGNLKSSNILIHRDGHNWHSNLTDYGFLPLLPCRKSSQSLSVGKSPEFSQGKKLTHKADVYCFGILLLEVITGKIPGEGDDDKVNDLSDWVSVAINNDWSTDILDIEILAAKEGHDEMLKLTQLALECTDTMPEKRPKMSQVLRRIQDIELSNTEKQ